MKTGLVLEGGALRTIYSSGVCDALLDHEVPLPDYVVGVSAGIAYGVSYLSQQKRRNLKLVTTYANDRRYMGMHNLVDPRNRSYFGLKFTYETIPTQLLPFDFDTFAVYPGTVEAVVTNLATGQAEYHEVPRRDCPNQQLIASCALPLLFPAVELNGQQYLDGGCADPIPWQRALDAGCDRVVVVLTRERDYIKEPTGSLRMIEQRFRKYPAFVEAMRTQAERYNACREALFAEEAKGNLLVLAPKDTLGCSRTERDLETLRALWQSGYFDGRRAAAHIRAFWTE